MSGRKMRIAVLLGGDSAERDVSIASAAGVMEALRNRGHEVRPVDPALPEGMQGDPASAKIGEKPPEAIGKIQCGKAFEWLTGDGISGADVVFIALHGGSGEDGTVQALLEAAGAVYTGTGILGSALAMNKDRAKALFREAGVQTAPHILVRRVEGADIQRVTGGIEKGPGFPAVVKPNCQGSSVGFSFVPEPSKLGGALELGFRFGDDLMIERFVPGREMTVAVLDGAALPVVEIIPAGGFYDYKSKYTKGSSRYEAPAAIPKEWAARLMREALLACEALSCRDYARVDFRVDERGEPFCLEVNTLPGMTKLSLVPMAAAQAGISFGDLVEKICVMALERGRKGE